MSTVDVLQLEFTCTSQHACFQPLRPQPASSDKAADVCRRWMPGLEEGMLRYARILPEELCMDISPRTRSDLSRFTSGWLISCATVTWSSSMFKTVPEPASSILLLAFGSRWASGEYSKQVLSDGCALGSQTPSSAQPTPEPSKSKQVQVS